MITINTYEAILSCIVLLITFNLKNEAEMFYSKLRYSIITVLIRYSVVKRKRLIER
jgi:hypothetical protein